MVCMYEGLGSFEWSACTRDWAVLNGLHVRGIGQF